MEAIKTTPRRKPGPKTAALRRRTKAAFLLALQGNGGNISNACETAKVHADTVWSWRKTDEEFCAEVETVLNESTCVLEDEAVRRAHDGVKKPVYQGGMLVGFVQEYSDSLLMFLLRGRRPEKYKNRTSNEHTGPGGDQIRVGNTLDMTKLSTEELAQLASIAAKAATSEARGRV